jgi:small subunit ribosomal protein S17
MAAKKNQKSAPTKKSGSIPPPKAASVRPPPPVEAAPAAPALVATKSAQKTHSFKRKLLGRVVGDKMNKTVVVEVNRYTVDRLYKKYVKQRAKYKVHDELNQYKVGDQVEIQEHRPLSREKRFLVVRLVSRPVTE